MAHLKLKTTKPAQERKANRIAPTCRRCGTGCTCSEEEIDAGGPA